MTASSYPFRRPVSPPERQTIALPDQLRVVAEVVDAHAEQPDRTLAGIGSGQELNGASDHLGSVAGRQVRVASRHGGEIRVADLDR